jgi:hypothetical protein
VAGELIWAFRIMRLPLRDAGGGQIGRVQDIVAVPAAAGGLPRVTGFVAESQRRRIFVNANRIADLGGHGMRTAQLGRRPEPVQGPPRRGPIGRDVIDHRVGDETVSDVAIHPVDDPRGRHRVRDRQGAPDPAQPAAAQAELSGSSTSTRCPACSRRSAPSRPRPPACATCTPRGRRRRAGMPLTQRRQLAAAMDDERLADLLEELPEPEQIRLIEELDLGRLMGVLDEMEFDDLADLLARCPASSGAGSSRRWMPRTPTWCAACSPTRRRRRAA